MTEKNGVERSTTTEILRRLLDERGVEWGNIRNDGSESDYLTEWQFEGVQGYAIAIEWSVGGGLSLETHRYHLTPAQAIAATLGSCNCTNGCTNSERTVMYTADETERIECGTIDSRHYDIHIMECSKCGRTYEHVFGDYEFCPHCGRRVVEVDA